VPDSGYVAVHTGVNRKAFCKQKFTAITPVCATSVRTVFGIHSPSVVFGGGLISMVGGLSTQAPLGLAPKCAGDLS